MTGTAEHVVTGSHNYTSPYLVAFTWHERRPLVDMLLGEKGPSASTFQVGDRPAYDRGGGRATRWLTVGHHDGFGAALFFDDPYFPHTPGAAAVDVDYDWAWISINPDPLTDPPEIQYDLSRPTAFPPRSVLRPDLLRTVVLEWVDTGERPTAVEWQAINLLAWNVTDTGDVVAPPRRTPRRTRRTAGPPPGHDA